MIITKAGHLSNPILCHDDVNDHNLGHSSQLLASVCCTQYFILYLRFTVPIPVAPPFLKCTMVYFMIIPYSMYIYTFIHVYTYYIYIHKCIHIHEYTYMIIYIYIVYTDKPYIYIHRCIHTYIHHIVYSSHRLKFGQATGLPLCPCSLNPVQTHA